MAQIVVNIPNAQAVRVVDALCKGHGYAGPDEATSRREFARLVVVDFLRREVARVERAEATAVAVASVQVPPVDAT